MSGYLQDTSIFVAAEQGRRVSPPPEGDARISVAERLADLLARARDERRRAGAMDAIIAATALVHDLVVWTQDDDFEVIAELAPELRVHRGA